MRKFGVAFVLVLISFQVSLAQKFGYIDTDFILSKMPDASKAQAEIDALTSKWQQEIQDKYNEIDKMQQDYRAEEILLTDEMKQQRLKAIQKKKDEAVAHNNKIFGFEGQLYLKKKELMQPLRDKIFTAVKKVVTTRKLEFMFDKASDLVMIYAHPRHDYTDYVLEELGLGDKEDAIQTNTTNDQ